MLGKRFFSILLSLNLSAMGALTASASEAPSEVSASAQAETREQTVVTEYYDDDIYAPFEEDETVETIAAAPSVAAESAILIELDSGEILFEKESHKQLPPASVTKIMSLLLVAEAVDNGAISLTDEVTASAHASSMGGSQIWLEIGETMTVDELLKATAVGSANDATVALAEYVAGAEDTFVDMMNRRARELNMTDTNFVNCTGLDADGHLTSANDIAIMARELMKHEFIKNYTTIWMDTLRDGETQLVNTNKLVRFYDGATGLKTGTTDKAGHCLCATAERGDMGLASVVLGCENSNDRFNSARTLLDYGFANWAHATPEIDLSEYDTVHVTHGVGSEVLAVMPEVGSIVVEKGREGDIAVDVDVAQELEAPVGKGQQIGNVTLSLDGKTLAKYMLTADRDVPRMTVGAALSILVKELFRM